MKNLSWNSCHSVLELKEGEAHVWKATLNEQSMDIAQWISSLSVNERRTADQFRFERDRNQYIVSHAILRQILQSYLGVPAMDFHFERNSFGKPILVPNPEGINFNLSHSENLALYAFTRNTPIGIDIEKIRSVEDLQGIARSFMSPREQELFLHLPAEKQLKCFYRVWTRKEALSKAMGKGLALQMDQWEVGIDTEARSVYKVTPTGEVSSTKWLIIDLEPSESYAGALAVEIPSIRVSLFKYP